MKMSSLQYFELTKFINTLEEKHGTEAIAEHRKNINYAHDQFISFCWSILWMIKSEDRKIITEGLLDVHLETALKKALVNYKETT